MSAIQDCKMRTIPRMELNVALTQQWGLEHIREELSNYFTLYWAGPYLKRQNVNGTIKKDGIQYNIVFYNCTAQQAYAANQVQLSFRNPLQHYRLPGFVLIRVSS